MRSLMRTSIPLCDTNVLSELARPAPDAGVQAWASTLSHVVLSVVSLEEIEFGLAWRSNARIASWFERFITEHCDVLPVTDDIARVCGQMRGLLRSRGQVRTQADMLIAATARVHNLTLVTRNTRDFEDCFVALLNPFSSR